MTDQQLRQQVSRLVADMEQEMRRLGLWSSHVPMAEALASRVPFCYDTLHFWQWLQWILIPRIRLIITSDTDLPETSDISPLAEVEFRRLSQDTSSLLQMIREFDQLITNRQS